MLNEPKIKEKIAKIIKDWEDYSGATELADQIYQLFLPALKVLEDISCLSPEHKTKLNELNGD